MKIIGFPGWSCTQTITSWFGYPIHVVDHFEQIKALNSDESKLRAIIPKLDWICVTWSMGTLMGLKLSELWAENPPKAWVALSPFLHFVGEHSNSYEEVMQLKASLLQRPESALKLFSRGHGVRQPWMDVEVTPDRVELLAESLDLLCDPMVVSKNQFEVPKYAIYGSKDSLVNARMVDEFVDEVGVKNRVCLDGLSHALFYEQPEELGQYLSQKSIW